MDLEKHEENKKETGEESYVALPLGTGFRCDVGMGIGYLVICE